MCYWIRRNYCIKNMDANKEKSFLHKGLNYVEKLWNFNDFLNKAKIIMLFESKNVRYSFLDTNFRDILSQKFKIQYVITYTYYNASFSYVPFHYRVHHLIFNKKLLFFFPSSWFKKNSARKNLFILWEKLMLIESTKFWVKKSCFYT